MYILKEIKDNYTLDDVWGEVDSRDIDGVEITLFTDRDGNLIGTLVDGVSSPVLSELLRDKFEYDFSFTIHQGMDDNIVKGDNIPLIDYISECLKNYETKRVFVL